MEFLKDGVDPIDVGDSKLMYEASAGSINASLSLISPENKVATLIMEERVSMTWLKTRRHCLININL